MIQLAAPKLVVVWFPPLSNRAERLLIPVLQRLLIDALILFLHVPSTMSDIVKSKNFGAKVV